jgi:outer membrane protein OmpA-like peptidoglycan-associated protein
MRPAFLLALVFPASLAAQYQGSTLPAAGAPWRVFLRAVQNPLPVGQCTAIEIVVQDPTGQPPLRPDGKQASGWDFELDFTAAAPDAFAWRDGTRRFLCAVTPTATAALVVARYPGRHLAPMEIVPGMATQQTIEVAMSGAQPTAAQYPGPQQADAYPGGAPPAPQGYQAPAYPQPMPQPAAYPPPPTPVAASTSAPAPGAAQPRVRTGKQFLQRVLGHVKQTADDAASSTMGAVADAAGEMIDTTLISVIGGSGQPSGPQDLAAGLASGRLVLTNLRFVEGTAQVDPSSGPLVIQLAAALIANAGQFLVEAHVDAGDPVSAQPLSDQRAAAVKAALVANGVQPMQLMAAGYGASRPIPGASTSARIEIARTQ